MEDIRKQSRTRLSVASAIHRDEEEQVELLTWVEQEIGEAYGDNDNQSLGLFDSVKNIAAFIWVLQYQQYLCRPILKSTWTSLLKSHFN